MIWIEKGPSHNKEGLQGVPCKEICNRSVHNDWRQRTRKRIANGIYNNNIMLYKMWYYTGNVLQAHGEGEHGEPGRGGRAEYGWSVRSGRAADDGHVQERGQTLGHDGPPELQRAEFSLDGHQRWPGIGSPPPAAGTRRPPVPLQPLDQLQHHVEVVVQLGSVVFELHDGRVKTRERVQPVGYLPVQLTIFRSTILGRRFFFYFSHYTSIRWASYRRGEMRQARIMFVSTSQTAVRCADERAPHCSGRTIEPTAAAGRALRWQVVFSRVERARRKKNNNESLENGWGSKWVCEWCVCAWCEREREQEDRASRGDNGSRSPCVHFFLPSTAGECCRLHYWTI